MKIKRIDLPPDDHESRAKVNKYLIKTWNPEKQFETAADLFECTREKIPENDDMKKLINTVNKDVAWEFYLYLSVGIKEAAYYLGTSFLNGYGTKQNDHLAFLTFSIGRKLGDHGTIEALEDAGELPDRIQKEADECIARIQSNSKEIVNRSITYEMLVGCGKHLDQLVKTFGDSYCDNIHNGAMKLYGEFIELE